MVCNQLGLGRLLTMAYYINEVCEGKRQRHRAVLHHADCASCNHGSGSPSTFQLQGSSGKWHGPFPSYREARDRHRSMDVQLRRRCHCL
jgi:hypothetical protein